MMYFTIGMRNITKNLRKNLLTILMVSFGMASLFIYNGSNSQMFKQFRDHVIHEQYGYFQLHAKGYTELGRKAPYDYLIHDYTSIEKKLLEAKDIDFVAPRLNFSGIASDDEKSTVVKGFGGVPAAEARMEYGKVKEGEFLDDHLAGEAVIGELVLKKLSSPVGSSITVLSSMKGGGMSAIDLKITGTKKGYGESDVMNQMLILADLGSVQNLIGAPDTVDTIIVHLKNEHLFSQKESAIARFCDMNGLEYKRWDDLAVFYERSREVFAMNENILTTMILIISLFIIINTLYMAYMGRIREIGTMRSIGTTKAQIIKITVIESIMLSIFGCTFGVAAGSVIACIINVTGGIYHPVTVFNENPYYTLIKPDALSVITYFMLFVSVSIVASLVLSFRTLRLSIADSLRWN
jgi:putative ABC transport system permease protein